MRFSYLFFDADDTIFDFKRSARHALGQSLEDFRLPVSEAHFQLYEAINHEAWLAFERQEITAEELRLVRFQRFLEAIGEFRDPVELGGHYLKLLSETDFLLDGAADLIAELCRLGHRMALITNGLKEVQRPRFVKSQLHHYFEAIVVSDEIGVSKPHAGFFEVAFGKMGNPEKSEVLVIGDSLNSDIQGGNSFGVATCWYNPRNSSNHTGHHPTHEIAELRQLLEII